MLLAKLPYQMPVPVGVTRNDVQQELIVTNHRTIAGYGWAEWQHWWVTDALKSGELLARHYTSCTHVWTDPPS